MGSEIALMRELPKPLRAAQIRVCLSLVHRAVDTNAFVLPAESFAKAACDLGLGDSFLLMGELGSDPIVGVSGELQVSTQLAGALVWPGGNTGLAGEEAKRGQESFRSQGGRGCDGLGGTVTIRPAPPGCLRRPEASPQAGL